MIHKRSLKNTVISSLGILFLIFIVRCDPGSETYVKRTDIVPITEFSIPDSAVSVTDTFQIRATAKVDNGCWGDMHFIFTELNDTAYGLKAYGTYESHGVCPDEEVSKDTSFDFSPVQKGYNLFFVTRNPYQYTTDTLIVND
ncbi:MAG: hypothetical protein ACQESJ_00855 [Bacteroidota bacterium]